MAKDKMRRCYNKPATITRKETFVERYMEIYKGSIEIVPLMNIRPILYELDAFGITHMVTEKMTDDTTPVDLKIFSVAKNIKEKIKTPKPYSMTRMVYINLMLGDCEEKGIDTMMIIMPDEKADDNVWFKIVSAGYHEKNKF